MSPSAASRFFRRVAARVVSRARDLRARAQRIPPSALWTDALARVRSSARRIPRNPRVLDDARPSRRRLLSTFGFRRGGLGDSRAETDSPRRSEGRSAGRDFRGMARSRGVVSPRLQWREPRPRRFPRVRAGANGRNRRGTLWLGRDPGGASLWRPWRSPARSRNLLPLVSMTMSRLRSPGRPYWRSSTRSTSTRHAPPSPKSFTGRRSRLQ